MSLPTETHAAQARRFPRVSGDEPTDIADLVRAAPFSPRERG